MLNRSGKKVNHLRRVGEISGRPVFRSVPKILVGIAAAILLAPMALLAQNSPEPSSSSVWIRPQHAGDPLIWGRRDGLVFGLPSQGGLGGPRGLIRVGIISPENGKPELLNFIAIEPVILGPGSRFGRMAFSELEESQLDPGKRGKRLWVADGRVAGTLETLHAGHNTVERLSVPIAVERYSANGGHVHLIASVDSDHPDELRLSVFAYPDSPPLEELTVTATMGNYERLRRLWLRGHNIDSLKLYGSYQEDAFTEHENYPLDEMLRTAVGGAIVLATSNEASPTSAPSHAAPHWHYAFPVRLTQYWRVDAYDIQPDLRVRVNGRRVYWASHDPLPGGPAFENFEVRQRYMKGQTFIFGVTPKEPWQFAPPIPELSEDHGIDSSSR
jgi:hypothetical protein